MVVETESVVVESRRGRAVSMEAYSTSRLSDSGLISFWSHGDKCPRPSLQLGSDLGLCLVFAL